MKWNKHSYTCSWLVTITWSFFSCNKAREKVDLNVMKSTTISYTLISESISLVLLALLEQKKLSTTYTSYCWNKQWPIQSFYYAIGQKSEPMFFNESSSRKIEVYGATVQNETLRKINSTYYTINLTDALSFSGNDMTMMCLVFLLTPIS